MFFKNAAEKIFHTYSVYARGDELLIGTYNYLDLTPKGRNETGPNFDLTDWVRRHDEYDHDDAGGARERHPKDHRTPVELLGNEGGK